MTQEIEDNKTEVEEVKLFYAASTSGFYRSDIHENIPEDAVEIDTEQHNALLEGQSEGKVISFNSGDNKPILIDKPELSDEVKWQNIKQQRGQLLSESDWTQLNDSPLDSAKKSLWKTYRQKLRDLTEDFQNPDDIVWPVVPA